MLDEAEAKIFKIAESTSRVQHEFLEMPAMLKEAVAKIDKAYSRENKDDVTGIPTGFIDLDKKNSRVARRRSHHRCWKAGNGEKPLFH